MCVRHGGCAMRGPAGVADARLAGEWRMHQKIRQVHQLAHRAAAIQLAVVDRGNPGTVIAAIFQPFQRLDQQRRYFVIAQYTDNSTHFMLPLSSFSSLS